MRDMEEIKSKFPTLFEMLGEKYIESLKSEQGALAKRATINPFFSILYGASNEKESDYIEFCFKDAVSKNSISMERLRRFKDEKKNVNLQNFINEIVVMQPVFEFGSFLDETNEGVTPDFLASLGETQVIFECVSVNETGDSEKQKNKAIEDTNKKFKVWKKDHPDGGVFSTWHESQPYGTIDVDKITDKIRKKKTSIQVKDFTYKVLVMSFRNMIFTNSSECLPNMCNHVDGIHSGIIYHAFYGKRGDVVFHENSFEGERHKLGILKSDGKFRRGSDYNICIVNFETEVDEEYKQRYVFLENFENPMPENLIYKLCDAFDPYETHSILKMYVK
jgi:hypothetical protein